MNEMYFNDTQGKKIKIMIILKKNCSFNTQFGSKKQENDS